MRVRQLSGKPSRGGFNAPSFRVACCAHFIRYLDVACPRAEDDVEFSRGDPMTVLQVLTPGYQEYALPSKIIFSTTARDNAATSHA
jgi:hypothetical protein